MPKITCPCGTVFYGSHAESYCPTCAPTVERFVVRLSAEQRKHAEALAVIRGVTVEQILREASGQFCTAKRGKRLTPEQHELAGSLCARKPGTNPHKKKRVGGGYRRPLGP